MVPKNTKGNVKERTLLVVRPHADHSDKAQVVIDLIDQAVLDIDPPRISANKFTAERFVRRRRGERICAEQVEQVACLRPKR